MWDVALSLLWFFAPEAGRALSPDDPAKSMALGLLVLFASLAFPPLGLLLILLLILVERWRPEPWSLVAFKPVLVSALLGHTLPHPEPLAFAEAVTQGGFWSLYAPLTYYVFKLAWWASPTAIAVGGSVAATAVLYQALRAWRGPREAALLTLLWPAAAFQYFSHHAFFYAATWTAWLMWEKGKRKAWLAYSALAAAFHLIMGPLAATPLLRLSSFQLLAALWILYAAYRGEWPVTEVTKGALSFLAQPSRLADGALALLGSWATLAALPAYLYILATSRRSGVYCAVASAGALAALLTAAYVPPDTARGYISRFIFLVLPFSGTSAWPLGLAAYVVQAYFHGV